MRMAKVLSYLLLSSLLALAAPAAAQLTFQPTSADFGQVQVDSTRSITIELTSAIVQDVTLSSLSAPFTVSPQTLTFDTVGETKPFTVTFQPITIGDFSQTITANGSIWGTANLPVDGRGVDVALSALADSLDYGIVSLGDSKVLNYVVNNEGTGDLLLSGGASTDSQFSVPATTYTVPEGGSATIPITFAPAFSGDQTATISLNTNAPDDPVISVVCIGSGASNISGNVSGFWAASNSPYRIVGDVTVPAGETLTIEAGSEVEFLFATTLTVNGTLRAHGSATNPIRFWSPVGSGSVVTGNAAAILDFLHCRFEDMGARGYADDFESGEVGSPWSGDGTISTNNPYEGTYCMRLYAQGSDKEAILGPFTVPGSATLYFRWRADRSDNNCYFRVQYRRNGGGWSELYNYYYTAGWNYRSFNISANSGDTIEFRFLADVYSTSSSYDEQDVYIDNVEYRLSGDKNTIALNGGSLSLANCDVSTSAGMGVRSYSATDVSIVGSTIADCAEYPLYLQSVSNSVELRQSVIRHNGQGGVIATAAPTTIDHCTIYDNDGVGLSLNSWPFVTISNSIFWLNGSGSNFTQIANSGAFVDITHSAIQGLASYGLTGNNYTVDPSCIGSNPQFADAEGHLSPTSPCVDAAMPWEHDAHMPPGLGTIVADMGAYGGPNNDLWGGTPIPDGAPQIQAIVDIPQDNGGFVGIQYDASLFDGQHPAYDITHYSFWRAMDLTAQQTASSEPLLASYYPTQAIFRTATNQYWEHVGDMIAQEFENYAYTAPTYADSVAGNSYDTEFLVIAHTPNTDIFFTSPPASGHSVDNLAPPAPEELMAQATVDGVLLEWPPADAPDVARYLIYRSQDQDSSIEGREPIAVSTDLSFLDDTVGELVDYFYVVAAEDVHGNLGEPSPLATALVPVPIALSEHRVEIADGLPELRWTVVADAALEFAVVRHDENGTEQRIDEAGLDRDGSSFRLRDTSAVPGETYTYTVLASSNGVWLKLFRSEPIETPRLEFGLRPVSPNPFNPATNISFTHTRAGRAVVSVYDVKGRRVRTLFDDDVRPGRIDLVWHGDDDRGARVGSGVYFVVLESHEGTQARKVMLVK